MDIHSENVDLFPEKVDTGVTSKNHCCNLQKSPISSRFSGVFGHGKSLFLGPFLPDFGSFLWFLWVADYLVKCCYSGAYKIWCKGVAKRDTLYDVTFCDPIPVISCKWCCARRMSMMNLPLHVDEDDAVKRGLIDSLGREQLTTSINESGLYVFRFSIQILCTLCQ